MKKSIIILTVIVLLTSCDFKQNHQKTHQKPMEKTSENESEKNNMNAKLVDFQDFTSLDLSAVKKDSMNVSNFGDCSRTISRYSSATLNLALDSMDCGDYGFHYTYYVFDNENSLELVCRKKSESFFDAESNSFLHTREIKFFDLRRDPSLVKTKKDTLTDFSKRNTTMENNFGKEELIERKTLYQQLQKDYKSAWKQN